MKREKKIKKLVFTIPPPAWVFRVGDLDLSDRRKRYTSSRKEEETDA